MAGIDFNSAEIYEREIFAFTASQIHDALTYIYDIPGIKGCAILSTCNRTELWASGEECSDSDLIGLLCRVKGVDRQERYEKSFATREGADAVTHLFETACGLRSQIIGEDQILTQVKSAIEQARDAKTADDMLEKLFQTAIASAKKIKANVRVTTADASVAHAAVIKAREYFGALDGRKCLVVGNGEMGRLAAELLLSNGAQVTITLRKHIQGKKSVPVGCKTIDYSMRHGVIPKCDVIISATVSPHRTVRKEDITAISSENKQYLFIDLAVPRDIDEGIMEYKNAALVNIDHLGVNLSANPKAIEESTQMILKYMQDYHRWALLRKYLNRFRNEDGLSYENISTELKNDIDALPAVLWKLKTSNKASFMREMSAILMKRMQKELSGMPDAKILVVGTGPGEISQITERARDALCYCDVIVGYDFYIGLISEHFGDREFIATPMTKEAERCELAVKEALKGKTVAVISGGDAGVYGMAGLMFEIAHKYGIDIEVIPGVTAAVSGGAVLGAPLAGDFAVISLSDLLTPWEVIEKRLSAAAIGDFAIAIYNPGSKTRRDYLKKACHILLEYKPPDTVCGIVRNIGRDGQDYKITTLSKLAGAEVDMFTTVFVGNAGTVVLGERMVTKRGYKAI